MRNKKGQFIKGGVGERRTHGLTGTPLHNVYFRIVNRCTNPKSDRYHRYGGRGIKNMWNSFEEFHKDMASSYRIAVQIHGRGNVSIDRKNNDGHYCKENCRWIPLKEQARNRSNNTYLEFHGETLPIVVWTEKLGITRGTIITRLKKGWPIERVLSEKKWRRFC